MTGGSEWHLRHRLLITASTSHGKLPLRADASVSEPVIGLEHAVNKVDTERASKVAATIRCTYSSVRNTRPCGEAGTVVGVGAAAGFGVGAAATGEGTGAG